jgi:hypothetical protein
LDAEPLVGGFFSHIDHIKGRLDFLSYLISNSDVRLSNENLDILWKQFILTALTPTEQEVTFGWFIKLAQTVDDLKTLHYVFQEKLTQLNFAEISISGLRCFIKYFITLNKRMGLLSPQEEVLEFSLLGFEALWKVPLEADNVDVFTEAVDFVTRLYLKVGNI